MNNNYFEDSESKAEWCAYKATEPNFVESISILLALALKSYNQMFSLVKYKYLCLALISLSE